MNSKYILSEKLGSGGYSTVFKCRDKFGNNYACKVLQKANNKRYKVNLEVNILSSLNMSTHIARLIDAREDDENYYLIQELCKGGTIDDALKLPCSERIAKNVLRSVLRGLCEVHDKGIIHRDIKSSNVLFSNCNTLDGDMKIIDFGAGVCNFSDSHMKCPEVIGTPWYMAPETIKKEFSHRSDIWSVGVLTYQMLCGKMPFDDPLGLYRQYAIFKSIMDDTPSLEDNGMKYISEEAKDFIIQCLNKNYIERPSAEDALNHAWLHYNDASSGRVLCTIPLQNAHINEEISFFI